MAIMPRHGMLTQDLGSFDLLSVDLFDTLLLRGTECEKRRFLEIAMLARERLRHLGHDLAAWEIFLSRMECSRVAYRAVEMFRPEGDVKLGDIHRLQTAMLRLPPALRDILLDAELEGERGRLAPNLPLLLELGRISDAGKRIVAVSDTYLPAAKLEWLLGAIAPGHPIRRVYSSSDAGVTKRGGRLFEVVCRSENVPAGRVLHCGDDPHSDFRMAHRMGLQAVKLARPHRVWLRRKLSALRFQIGAAGRHR
jgi:FMN phosphatase YigB (HAD superfamily)